MNHVILNAAHRYFTGDWDEDAPKWSPKPDDAYHFTSKEEALDTMRRHIDADRAAERVPGFAGCRVASVVAEAFRTLRKKGLDVKIDGADVIVIVVPKDAPKMKATLPTSLYGVRIGIRTPLGQVLR